MHYSTYVHRRGSTRRPLSIRDDDAPLEQNPNHDAMVVDTLKSVGVNDRGLKPKGLKWKREGKEKDPPSIFRHIIMDIARKIGPATDVNAKVFKFLRRMAGPKPPPLAEHYIKTRYIPNVVQYTEHLQSARAGILEDIACQNINAALKLTKNDPILPPRLESYLISYLADRNAFAKKRTDLVHIFSLMHSTSVLSWHCRGKLARPPKRTDRNKSGIPNTPTARERNLKAGKLIGRSVELLLEAGILRLKYGLCKWERSFETAENKLNRLQRKFKKKVTKINIPQAQVDEISTESPDDSLDDEDGLATHDLTAEETTSNKPAT